MMGPEPLDAGEIKDSENVSKRSIRISFDKFKKSRNWKKVFFSKNFDFDCSYAPFNFELESSLGAEIVALNVHFIP